MLRDKHDKRLYVKQFYFFIRFTASCSPLNAPSNGNLHNNQTKHGTVVSFSCNSGFKLKGLRQIMCVDGKWNGSSPACKGLSLSYAVLNFPRHFLPLVCLIIHLPPQGMFYVCNWWLNETKRKVTVKY